MRTKTPALTVVGLATLATIGLAIPAAGSEPTDADARAGTPHGKKAPITVKDSDGKEHTYGSIEWRDVDEVGDDADVVRLNDKSFDGASSVVHIRSNGEKFRDHAYNGESRDTDVGNPTKGDKIYVKGCGWNNGSQVGCTEWKTITE